MKVSLSRLAAVALAFQAALFFGTAARADNLVVLAAAAAKRALRDVPEQFRKRTGNQITFSFGTAGEMSGKALSGAPVDLLILPPAALAALTAKGIVARGSREDLGVVRLAAAVRSGAPTLDISNEAALKSALVNAASIGMADPAAGATSGIYLAKLMKRLGIAEALKSKLRFYPDGQEAMEAVARGEVAVGLGQRSEITPVQNVHIVGDLPDSVQLNTIYSAALAARAADNTAARALFAFLVGPETRASLLANGFDPPN